MTRVSTAVRSHVSFIVAAVVLGLVASILGRRGEVDTALGVLVGGAVALAAAYVLRWRALRRGSSSTPADRVAAGRGDERDQAVLSGAWSTTGVGALLVAVLSSVLVTLGVDAHVLVSVTPYVLMALFAVGFFVTNRRI